MTQSNIEQTQLINSGSNTAAIRYTSVAAVLSK